MGKGRWQLERFLNQKAQTLIETLISLLIIVIGVLALIRFQTYLSYDNSLAQQKMEATILAAKQLETLRDYQVLNNTSGYTSYQSIASGSGSTSGVNASYTVSWTVNSFTNPSYKTLDVTVTWLDRNGGSQSVRLVDYVAAIDPSTTASVT